jgi:CheY-like chemotaxis protein
MSQVQGLDILRAALAVNRDTIVVVMTGNPSVTTSIEALREGAWDYLPKPFSATPPAGADRPGLPRRHGQPRGDRAASAVDAAAQPQRQPAAHRHFSDLPQGGGAGAEGRADRRVGVSSAAKAAPARKSLPSSSITTAGDPSGSWSRSTAPPSRSRCWNPRCSGTARVRSPGGPGETRSARNRQRRHPLPGRADRDVTRAPGQAAPGDPGRRGAPGGFRKPGDQVDVRFISATNR